MAAWLPDRRWSFFTPSRLPWTAAVLLLGGWCLPVNAGPRPLPPGEQEKVNLAIDRGLYFLEKTQGPLGTWAHEAKHAVGYAALPGLTMLECGRSPQDPMVKKAAAFVRNHSAHLDSTYEISLALLFLDRLGDARDRPLIQTLGLRLIAGQSPTGGWTYRCPVLTPLQQRQLFEALRAGDLKSDRLQPALRGLPVLKDLDWLPKSDPSDQREVATWGTTDNSNTQFAILAAWTARRHGVPTERTLERLARRFRASQNRTGGWGYGYSSGGDGGRETPQMTCAGLLGLAIGHGLAHDVALARKGPPAAGALPAALGLSTAALGSGTYPAVAGIALLSPALPDLFPVPPPRKIGLDPLIRAGFQALYRQVGQPTGRMEGQPKRNLYFLWSLERVGMLYDLETLGDKDWYRWGAEILVSNQWAQGQWQGGGYPGSTPVIDTCLALLFLKRVNLTLDLTARLPFDPADLGSPPEPAVREPEPQPVTPAPEEPVLSRVQSPPRKAAVAEPVEVKEDGSTRKAWVWLLALAVFVLLFSGTVLITRARSGEERHPVPRRARNGRRMMRANG
jgi:hypothetical protein